MRRISRTALVTTALIIAQTQVPSFAQSGGNGGGAQLQKKNCTQMAKGGNAGSAQIKSKTDMARQGGNGASAQKMKKPSKVQECKA